MLRLRDPDAAAMLARMRTAWAIGLNPEPRSETVPYTPPAARKGGQNGCHAVKRMIWAGSSLGRQAKGGAGGQAPFDYAAWCADVAIVIKARPSTSTELADHYGIEVRALHARLTVARRDGHWPPPPAGTKAVWSRNSYTAPRLRLEVL